MLIWISSTDQPHNLLRGEATLFAASPPAGAGGIPQGILADHARVYLEKEPEQRGEDSDPAEGGDGSHFGS